MSTDALTDGRWVKGAGGVRRWVTGPQCCLCGASLLGNRRAERGKNVRCDRCCAAIRLRREAIARQIAIDVALAVARFYVTTCALCGCLIAADEACPGCQARAAA